MSDMDETELAWSEKPPSRRVNVLTATGFLASLAIAALTAIPAPYAIASPGPTFDTLSEVEGVPLVNIDGAPTYDATGELRLTTVSVARAGSTAFSMGSVFQAFFSPSRSVSPQEWYFPDADPEEREQEREASAQQWITSQESATVSALAAQGVEVPTTLYVAAVDENSRAVGLVRDGDVITGLNGIPMGQYLQLADAMDALEPGDEVDLTVERDGDELTVSFDLIEAEDGSALMGLYIDPDFHLPVDVEVLIDHVGGPSAGMMFALAILNLMSPEDELSGAEVAGTGVIGVDGDVGPIGGIQQKMWGAVADGADHFLAPVENCPDVVGHIPDGLSVYAVDTLDDAYAAIVAIGAGATETLPTCSSATDNL